ncbi:MAG: OsmC family protein [Flavobacteriales bacterium]|jgi:putative redox protein|nr:OsmC family protein [Flavobacteriales bacterium]
MITTKTTTKDQYKTDTAVRDYNLQMDNSPANNGGNYGASPKEHLTAALGGCTTMTLKMYIERKGWEVGSITADTSFEMKEDRSTAFHIHISIEGDFDEKQQKRLKAIAPKCPVHKLLAGNSEITVSWDF